MSDQAEQLDRPEETFQSKFPGILDYDELKFLQLRYQFREHDFALQWKAMQAAGWTYSGGAYKSPEATLGWGNPIEIIAQLDSCAVAPVTSNLQVDPPVIEDNDWKESVEDLRNAICYHMQLLIEKGRRCYNDSNEGNLSHAKETSGNDDDGSIPLRILRRRAAATRAPNASVTAAEKGSDLYLHKKGRKKSKKKNAKDFSTVTSNDDLPLFPTLSDCRELVQTFDVAACATIEAYHAQHGFPQWRHLLSTNHSLLFYGNGSKYNVLTQFCDMELSKEGYVLQIDGFDPDVTIDAILDLLVSLFLHGKEPDPRECEGLFLRQMEVEGAVPELHNFRHPTTVDRAVVIARGLAKHCAETGIPIFLVIHSLEGLCFELAQDALAALVVHAVPDGGTVAALRLVASMDHVDASAALWSSSTASNFRWFWKEIHTYRPYINELAMLADEDVSAKKAARKQDRATQQAARVSEVLENLAPRYGQVMQILAKLQLKELKSSSRSPWVDYKVFRTECKTSLLIDKDFKLRALQIELSDHRLMISKTDGQSEFVSIPYDIDKLEEIIASTSIDNR